MLDDRNEKLTAPIKFVASPTLREKIEEAIANSANEPRLSISEWCRRAAEEKLERELEG